MKKMALLILALAGLSFGAANQVAGQFNVASGTVYFGSDSSGAILFENGQIYRDSSGTFVRIDNTADSCSQPLVIEKRGVYPIWNMELRWTTRATATASSAFRWEMQTRYCAETRISQGCEDWVPTGRAISDPNVAISDTIQTLDMGGTAAARESGHYFVTGSQVRICPVSQTTGGASDSVHVYDIIQRTR